jgi:hypothetical protein
MPILRQEIYEFVEIWNYHAIRKQRKRPYLPTGKPVVLYMTPPPGVRDYGLSPDPVLLETLRADVEAWGK